MIISNSVNLSVEILLSGAVTTNQLQVTTEWVDLPSADFASGYTATTTNGATAVEIVPAIETNKRREVKAISVYNSDTVASTVTIRYNVATVYTTIIKVTLGIGFSLYYTGTQWQVLDASGATTSSVTALTVVPDGDYADIVVSGSGLIYTLKASINKAITGIWSFSFGKFSLKNAANTFGTNVDTAATANRTWSIPEEGADRTFASRTYVDSGDALALLKANNLSDVANAATSRTNLGATTVGSNLLIVANPSAITFLRVNADNTVTLLSAANFRTALSLVVGTDVQAYDATLAALAALTIAADSLTIGTGADAFSQTTFAANTFPAKASTGNLVAKTITDFGLSLVDDTNAAAARTTLGLVIGTNVQAWNAFLDSWAAITRATGFDTFVATPSGANFFALLTTKTGTALPVFQTTPTLNQPNIVGTTTNDNAAAGSVGEEMLQSRLQSAASGLTSTTVANVTATALTLTAGDWDVSAAVGFLFGTLTSVTRLQCGISLVSATLSSLDTMAVPSAAGEFRMRGQQSNAGVVKATSGNETIAITRYRVSLSATTTFYLVAEATFTVSTVAVYGAIIARRVR